VVNKASKPWQAGPSAGTQLPQSDSCIIAAVDKGNSVIIINHTS
jgi:hypothetical protein